MRSDTAVIFIVASLVIPVFGLPSISAAVPADNPQAGPIVSSPELNMTGVDIANHSIPSRYGVSPTLIDVKVGVSETVLPGPKGEMAAGPRTIGFTAEPVALVILVIAIIAGSAVAWCLTRRKPEAPDDNDQENEG